MTLIRIDTGPHKGWNEMHFNSLFSSTQNDYIYYKKKKIYAVYRYNKLGKHKVKFKFISSNRQREQCILLLGDNKICDIKYNGKKYNFPKTKFPTCDPFEKDFGKEFILEIDLKSDSLGICNGQCLKWKFKVYKVF